MEENKESGWAVYQWAVLNLGQESKSPLLPPPLAWINNYSPQQPWQECLRRGHEERLLTNKKLHLCIFTPVQSRGSSQSQDRGAGDLFSIWLAHCPCLCILDSKTFCFSSLFFMVMVLETKAGLLDLAKDAQVNLKHGFTRQLFVVY